MIDKLRQRVHLRVRHEGGGVLVFALTVFLQHFEDRVRVLIFRRRLPARDKIAQRVELVTALRILVPGLVFAQNLVRNGRVATRVAKFRDQRFEVQRKDVLRRHAVKRRRELVVATTFKILDLARKKIVRAEQLLDPVKRLKLR